MGESEAGVKLHLFTICLDAFPFITCHLPVLNQLKIDWHWTVAEGVAANVLDTAWCAAIPPRLSRDGTTEYLNSIRAHPRVTVLQRPLWNGKLEMCNACLSTIKEPCVLMQVDSDELWTAGNYTRIHHLLSPPGVNHSAVFRARYFVGQNLIITSDNTYGNRNGEWLRAWRFAPGMRFSRHEPPILVPEREGRIPRDITAHLGLVMNHYAYATESAVRFKEVYYQYPDAVKHWLRLQAHDKFPARLGDFLPWVTDEAIVDRLYP